jgi:hypothetical protein
MNDLQKIMQELARVEPDWFQIEPRDDIFSFCANRGDDSIMYRWHNNRFSVVHSENFTDYDSILGAVIDAAQARGWGMILIAPREGASRATIVSPTPICELADQESSILAIAAALALLEAHGVEI